MNQIFRELEELDIVYEVIYHPAVFTIEDMDELGISGKGDIVKNLFLRDAKGKKHYLVVLKKDKKADLKSLRTQLGSTALSFASEERLEKYLGLSRGAVTPLGIVNDISCAVEVVFDKDLIGNERLGVHPNENTATVFLSFSSLIRIIEKNGNKIHFVEV